MKQIQVNKPNRTVLVKAPRGIITSGRQYQLWTNAFAQEVSYAPYDEGWQWANVLINRSVYPTPSQVMQPDLSYGINSMYAVTPNNKHGNNARFTNPDGAHLLPEGSILSDYVDGESYIDADGNPVAFGGGGYNSALNALCSAKYLEDHLFGIKISGSFRLDNNLSGVSTWEQELDAAYNDTFDGGGWLVFPLHLWYAYITFDRINPLYAGMPLNGFGNYLWNDWSTTDIDDTLYYKYSSRDPQVANRLKTQPFKSFFMYKLMDDF